MSTVKIQLRRGTAAQWTAADNVGSGVTLLAGEIAVETDTRRIKIGDGTTRWNSLPYAAEENLANYVTLGTAQTITNKTLGSGTALGANLSAGTNKITNLGTPTDAADAATKAYVDAVSEGLHIHQSVVAATTTNLSILTDLENGDIVDGVTLATGDRVLVKNQTSSSENGIYVVQASGAAVRASDYDSPSEIDGGDFVFVTNGNTNDNTGWVQTNTVGTIGVDPISFTQFSGTGTYTAGTGLLLNGNQFSINTAEYASSNLSINQRTESYTLAITDKDKLVELSSTSALSLIVPTESSVPFPVGTQINILQTNSGQVTLSGASGVTVNGTPGLKLRAQWSSATLIKRSSSAWVAVGDLVA